MLCVSRGFKVIDDVSVTVWDPVIIPFSDNVPWLLCQGDIPLADWAVCMTSTWDYGFESCCASCHMYKESEG